jgi:predicted enzyme related to lactoylglutathione lyase
MTASQTAKLTASAPVLFVRDVHAAATHYRDAMGFSFEKIWGEPPSFAILQRDAMFVMVKQIDDHRHIVPRWTVSPNLWDMYFWVDNVDALYEEFVKRGAKIDYGLCHQPHGCREFGAQDIDGHDIGFGQIVSS